MTYVESYLIHSGVKGQVHGVRNYQNYDGSLTELGREHYGVGPPRNAMESLKIKKGQGSIDKLSNKELQDRINRLNNEAYYQENYTDKNYNKVDKVLTSLSNKLNNGGYDKIVADIMNGDNPEPVFSAKDIAAVRGIANAAVKSANVVNKKLKKNAYTDLSFLTDQELSDLVTRDRLNKQYADSYKKSKRYVNDRTGFDIAKDIAGGAKDIGMNILGAKMGMDNSPLYKGYKTMKKMEKAERKK